MVARRAHNPEVVGSSPASATTEDKSRDLSFFVILTKKLEMKKIIFLICAAMLALTSCEKADSHAWIYGTWNIESLVMEDSDGFRYVYGDEEFDEDFIGTMEFDEAGDCAIFVGRYDGDEILTFFDDTYAYVFIDKNVLNVGMHSMTYSHDGDKLFINGNGSFIIEDFLEHDAAVPAGVKTTFVFSKQK